MRPPFSCAAHAGLDFVGDKHDAVLATNALEFLQEEVGSNDVAAFALNRLDDDAGDFLGIKEAFEDLLFEYLKDFRAAGFRSVAEGAAIGVRKRNVLDAGKQSAKTLALRGFRSGQRKSAHGAAVKAAVERDHFVALGGITRELDGAFDGFRARIGEERLFGSSARQRVHEPLGETRHTLVVKIGAGHVDEFGGLLLNGGDDFGMAMAGRTDGDAGGKIQKCIAIHVFDNCAVTAFGDERVIPGIGRRHELAVALDDAPGVGAGQRGKQLR